MGGVAIDLLLEELNVSWRTVNTQREEGGKGRRKDSNGPYAKFLNRAHLFLKRGAGDLIFITCDSHGLNNVVFNFGEHI